ncbi:MAG: SCP2 sterol-binding domain-containing protein [Deltaproteobacteria bacterium]|nr:SCP2 sterol-binding domain-containing protein [Deltaproteobacteria bacterium]
MADPKEELRARIFLRSALPLIKVVLAERPKYAYFLYRARGVVQFAASDSSQGAHVEFADGGLQVTQGMHDKPDLRLTFKRLSDLNAFFAGALKAPSIAGLFGLPLLVRLLPFLLKLKLLMPDAMPNKPAEKALKVKLLIFMVTNALSQLNKGGDEAFGEIVKKSPDRIFQWTVKDGPAAYLRMKAGKTKAGRGSYTRRQPFVHMMFPDIDSAFDVLTQKVSTVDAVKQGKLKMEGSMEYGKEIGLHMQRIEALTTGG